MHDDTGVFLARIMIGRLARFVTRVSSLAGITVLLAGSLSLLGVNPLGVNSVVALYVSVWLFLLSLASSGFVNALRSDLDLHDLIHASEKAERRDRRNK